MSYEDERIVKLSFDNEAFKKGVSETLVALRNLEQALDVDPRTAARSFDNLSYSINNTQNSMTSLESGMEKVKVGFSMLEVAGITAFASLTSAAISFGRNLYQNTLGQITAGGFSRALNLENAKFQIEGLDKSWTDLKEDILYGVKDTAYGLDEAAKVASQLSASNIEAGDQMKRTLRGISGVAAMTNSSYSDIGQIFTTMASQGRVMGHELTRLSYRGLNVAAKLAEYYREVRHESNATEASIRQLASEGKISFTTFANAMDWAFGEHAKEANKTFTGAMSNMRAALSRLGEAFQSPMLEFRRKIAVSVVPVIDKVAKALNKYTIPVFSNIIQKVSEWGEKLLSNYTFMKFIYNVVMGVYSWIHEIIRALWQLGVIEPNVQSVAEGLERATHWMVLNGERAEKFRNVIKFLARTFEIFVNVIEALIWVLEPIYVPIVNFLKKTCGYVGDVTDGTESLFVSIKLIIKVVSVLLRMGIEKSIIIVKNAILILITALQLFGYILGYIALLLAGLLIKLFDFAKAVYKYAKSVIDSLDWLKKGFVSLYETVRDIFKHILQGLSDFAEATSKSVGSAWDKLSGFFEDKTMKANVVINTIVPNNSKAINSNAAALNNATNAANSYNTATTQAAKNAQTINDATIKVAANSGGGQGKFGVSGFSNLAKNKIAIALQDDQADQTDKNAEKVVKSVTDMNKKVGKSVSTIDKVVSESVMFGSDSSFGENLVNKINDIVNATSKLNGINTIFRGLITFITVSGVVLVSLFDTIITGLFNVSEKGSETIPKLLENLADGIIGAVKKIVLAIPEMLGEIGIAIAKWDVSLRSIVKIIRAIINMILIVTLIAGLTEPNYKIFEALSLFILAFGAVLVALGYISTKIDPTIFDMMMDDISHFAIIITIMLAMLGILELTKTYSKLAGKLAKLCSLNFNAMDYHLFEMIMALSGLIGMLAISIMSIMTIVKVVNEGDYTSLIVTVSVLVGTLAAIILLVAVLMAVAGKVGGISMAASFSGKIFGKKDFTKNITNTLGGCIALVSAITPLITMLGLMVALLSTRDLDTVVTIFTMFMITFTVFMAGILGIMVYLTQTMKRMPSEQFTKINKKMNQSMLMIVLITRTISRFMMSITACAVILGTIDTYKVNGVVGMLITIVVAMAAAVAGFMFAMRMMQKMQARNLTGPGLGKLLVTMTGIMAAISATIFVISISMRILASADPTSLTGAAIKLGAIMVAMALVIGVLVLASNKMSVMNPSKLAAMSVTLGNIAGIMGILVGAVSSIALVLVLLTKALDTVKDTSSIIWGVGILSGIFVALGAFYLLINKTANLMPSLQSVYGLVLMTGALVTMILAISVLMKVISTIDVNISFVLTTIGALALAFISLFALSKIVSGAALVAASAAKGLLVIGGFIAVVGAVVIGFAYSIGLISEQVAKLADSLNQIIKLDWKGLIQSTGSMKIALDNIVSCIMSTMNIKSLIGITLLSTGLYLLANAVKGLSNVKAETLSAFANAIKTVLTVFQQNAPAVIMAVAIAGLFMEIGWSLAIGMVGFLVFTALVPALAKSISTALDSIKKLTSIEIDIQKSVKFFEDLIPLAFVLFEVGVLFGVGGVGLAIGGLTLYAGIAMIQKATDLVDAGASPRAMETYLDKLATIAAWTVFDGWLLSSGAGMLAIGAVLMIAAVGVMKGVYKIIKSDYKKLDMAIGYMGGLILLAGVTLVAAVAMIVSSAILGVASLLFLTSCVQFTLSLFLLNKAFSVVDFSGMLSQVSNVVRLCEMLGEIGFVLWVTMPMFIVGTALLALAMFGFAVAGAEILIGIGSIALAISILQKLFDGVDFEKINENAKKLVEFGGIIGIVGEAMRIGIEPFTYAAVLLSVAVVSIAVALAASGLSILIAAASFLGAMYILTYAFDYMIQAFSKMTAMDLIGMMGLLAVFGAGIIAAGLLLSIGSVPFLLGSVVVLVAALALSAGLDKLHSSLDLKKVSKTLTSLALFSAAITIFGMLSPIFITCAGLFYAFALVLDEGAKLFYEACVYINAGMEEFGENAGQDMIIGLINGMMDKVGVTDLIKSTNEIGDLVKNTLDENWQRHSPPYEFVIRAADAIGAIADTFGADGDKVSNAIKTVGTDALDTLSSFIPSFGEIGANLGLTGGSSLINNLRSSLFGQNGIGSVMSDFGSYYSGSMSSIFGATDEMAASRYRAKAKMIRLTADEEYQNSTDPNRDEKMREAYKLASDYETEATRLDNEKKVYDVDIPDASRFLNSGSSSSPVVSPETEDELSSMATGNGKGSDLAKSAAGNAQTAVTNNTYNFTQNNYSPEPIDRTELYVQTNNQLDTWYKWVRDNGGVNA